MPIKLSSWDQKYTLYLIKRKNLFSHQIKCITVTWTTVEETGLSWLTDEGESI